MYLYSACIVRMHYIYCLLITNCLFYFQVEKLAVSKCVAFLLRMSTTHRVMKIFSLDLRKMYKHPKTTCLQFRQNSSNVD